MAKIREKINNWLINVDSQKINKRATFWNLIASLLNACMSAIFLFFVTRISGVEEAGVFSIASAYAYQCISLGNFGVRNFHASDVKKKYSYDDYLFVRIISCILMYLLLIYFSFLNGYNLNKILIILSFGIFKSIDCYEDLVHGEFQRNGRLDVANILQSFRYFITIIFFIIFILLCKNLVLVCFASTIFTLIIFWQFNKKILKKYVTIKPIFAKSKVFNLFLSCLPICIGNAINMYIVNCPKYAIDNILNDNYQTYFAMLVLPVFTINLLSTVIYRPQVKSLGDYWTEKKYSSFFKLIHKQVCVIFILTILICLFGYFVGLNMIEFIYGIKLDDYMLEFLLLLVSGGLNSLAGYLSVVLTAEREQSKIFIGFFASFLTAIFLSTFLVKSFKIMGAAYLACIINLVTTLFFAMFIFIKFIRDKKVQNG